MVYMLRYIQTINGYYDQWALQVAIYWRYLASIYFWPSFGPNLQKKQRPKILGSWDPRIPIHGISAGKDGDFFGENSGAFPGNSHDGDLMGINDGDITDIT
jgi:hypothetical protein